jgi:hypothetical protein
MKELNQRAIEYDKSPIFLKELIDYYGGFDELQNIMNIANKEGNSIYDWYYFYKVNIIRMLTNEKWQSAKWFLDQLLLISDNYNIPLDINNLINIVPDKKGKEFIENIFSQV